MPDPYTARELVRAAGFTIRRVDEGGVRERVDRYRKILEVGPYATELDLVRAAAPYIVLPPQWRKLVDAA